VRVLSTILLVLLVGCAAGAVAEASRNRSNLLKLNVGQTRDQVLSIMGPPYSSEMYALSGKHVEFLLYYTQQSEGRGLSDRHFTPVAIQNGFLQGWGRNYYDNAIRIKQDVTIERK
jgi:hypothetical protein